MKPQFLLLLSLLLIQCTAEKKSEISLAGTWQVQLDSLDQGESNGWHTSAFTGITIDLPGTLDDNGLGKPNTLQPALNNYVLSNLARKHSYIGKAWYQRHVQIPDVWEGKQIMLKLERVLWQSKVYVNGTPAGTAESLVGSHQYDLSELLPPGDHLLTIVIDNANQYPFINVTGNRYPDPVNQDMAHAYTNHTQIKWNGMLGKIRLVASEKTSPENLQIYADVTNGKLTFSYLQVIPKTEKPQLIISDAEGHDIYNDAPEAWQLKDGRYYFEMDAPGSLKLWDEFNPHLYRAQLVSGTDTLSATFGYREINHKEGMLMLNGKRIFLRGNLECAIFPLTGHPPMEKEAWAKLIATAKDYGLNHLRFHSWCPPKAAFEAADEAGFYLQAELPHWSLKVGQDPPTTAFLRNEAEKILTAYGNHPSFVLMSLGNELQGDTGLLNTMVAELKKKDRRRLYTTTSFSFQKPTGARPEPEDEFFITQWTEKGWIRGQGVFNVRFPGFNEDYSDNIDHIKVPLISHEIGQYSVYPDLNEISRYTGVLAPLNFIAIKNDLEKKGLSDLSADFTQASGKLAAMLYKEEIERALKTPGFDGFQLLQLQDFPGQGTALVGLLNAFWESKDIITGKEFRKFNSPVVPLLRFDKAVYEAGETFRATIEIANFLEDRKGQTIDWSVKDEQGNTLAGGAIDNIDLRVGNNTELGTVAFEINTKKAKQLTVQVALGGTPYRNDWPVWVYPKSMAAKPTDVLITTSIPKAISALEAGKKVFLNPEPEQLEGIEGQFVPVFWSPVHFPDQPSTMGLLIDDEHKALEDFPTKFHTEWQWWDLCIHSKSVIIDSLNVQPIVRVIDNFVTNRQLANVFEARAGEGKLLFSSIDLRSDLDKRPVARQLRNSLLRYMGTENFAPVESLNKEDLVKIAQ